MTRIRDVLLEIRIWWAKECAMSCLEYAEAERPWAEHDISADGNGRCVADG